ncbi:proteasome subunit beta type-5-like [Scaptodrosophila lebanonensis]|uniref:Proteasome subunit beta n=1 Tax=Drosophila lebanonensis TaxID=7225 RepID=A0A6J2T7Q4_DROLE|nr:proteasome subunit beta type-5-like [Scaptodrosophila lebanonensis]
MAMERLCGFDKLNLMKSHHMTSMEFGAHNLSLATSNFTNPYALMAPRYPNPDNTLPKLLHECPEVCKEIDHGTTTIGFKYQGGVVLCADSRATAGSYVNSQTVRKIVELNDYMLGTMAGCAADCTYWHRVLTYETRLHELRFRQRLPVDSVARIMSNVSYQYRGMGLSMGMMLAGCDSQGVKLMYVDSDGVRLDGNCFSVGSGCTFALSYLDTNYKWELTDEEAYDLARRAICQATYTDAFSGGTVRLYHITPKGWKNISNTDCKQLREIYEADKKEKLAEKAALEKL